MKTPYPHQTEIIKKTREAIREGFRRVLIVAPPGAGKTFIGSLIFKGVNDKGNRAVWTSHRSELLQQAGGAFDEAGLSPVVISAGCKTIPSKNNLFNASVKMYAKLFEELGEVDLIVFDEAHRGEYRKIFKKKQVKGDPIIIGLTATPQSADKKDPLGNYWDCLIMPYEQHQLVEADVLCTCTTYATDFDTQQAGLVKNAKGYTEKSQEAHYTKKRNITNVVERWSTGINKNGVPFRNTKTLLFAPSIETCKVYVDAFAELGASVAMITGKTDNVLRKKLMEDYDDGKIQIMCNVQVMTAGTNVPTIETVIGLSRTALVSTYMQAMGRGGRTSNVIHRYENYKLTVINERKTHFSILDFGASCYELRVTWDSRIDWQAIFEGKKTFSEGCTPMKTCKSCEALILASASVCEHCGEECPVRQAFDVFAQLIEVGEGGVTDAEKEGLSSMQKQILVIRKMQLSRGYKDGWYWRRVFSDCGVEGLGIIAEAKNYDGYWITNLLKRWGV